MSRILCMSDTQLGVTTVTLDSQREVLDRIIAVALDNKVDLVLHAGDVFEGPTITPEQLRVFVDATAPLDAHGVPLLITRGNGRHDLAVRPVHALDILREIQGIHVSDRPEVHRFSGVSVCTLPWVDPGRLLAQMNGNIDRDHVNESIARSLVDPIAKQLLAEAKGASDGPAILLAHWAVSGAALPSGLPVEEMREPVLPWPDIDALGFDACVFGHIHQPQQLHNFQAGDTTTGFIVGSPQQLNFGESGEHGVWLLDVEEKIVRADFIPIASPQFVTVCERPDKAEIRSGDYVRVRYTATEEEARRIDHDALRAEMITAGAARVTFAPNIIHQARARAETISDTLTAAEALRAYCQAHEIPDEMRERMLDMLREWQS